MVVAGLEVQKHTQALKSVKGPGNTFDLSPKWARILLLVILQEIFIDSTHPISKLKFCTLLWA